MDVLFLVARHAPGDHIELRYSLRTLSNLAHGRVWIAGHLPEWVRGVGHIPVAQGRTSHETGRRVLLEACRAADPTPNVILMHDDYYLMEPVSEVVARHRGPLAALLTRSRFGWYHDATRRTLALLARQNISDPLCYDATHTPMVIDRRTMADLLHEAGTAVQYKSLYGNICQIGGVLGDDAKRYRPGELYASTDAPAGPVWPLVKRRFPDPSPHEEVPMTDAEELAALRDEAAELGLDVPPTLNRAAIRRRIEQARDQVREPRPEPTPATNPTPVPPEVERQSAASAGRRRSWAGPKGRRRTTTRGSALDRWYESAPGWRPA